jgi:hypothetical protein
VKLFVGNASKQNVDFIYTVRDLSGQLHRRTQNIGVGEQIQISGDLEQSQIDMIIQHHAPYGFAAVTEVDYVKDYTMLCYSIGKPVPVDKLRELMINNTTVLHLRGKEIRKESAIAGNEQLEATLAEAGRPERLNQLETSIVEENHDERDETPAVAEGFRVIRGDGPPASPPVTRRTARRRASGG